MRQGPRCVAKQAASPFRSPMRGRLSTRCYGPEMRLYTGISTDECRRRLTSAINREGVLGFLIDSGGSKPMLGKIRGDSFRIQKRILYRNSFRPCLFGRFVPCNSGTLIEAHFGIHPSAKASMISYYSFLAIWMCLLFGSVAMGRTSIKDLFGKDVLFFLIPIGMLLFGFVCMKLGKWLGRGDTRVIATFLTRTLEAMEATA